MQCTVPHYLSLPPVSVVPPVRRPPGVHGVGHGEPSQVLGLAPAAPHHGAHDGAHQGQGVHLAARGRLAPHLPGTHAGAAAVASVAAVVSSSGPSSVALKWHCRLNNNECSVINDTSANNCSIELFP